MFAKPIENFLVNTGANVLTEAFIIVLMAIFVLAILFKLNNKQHGFTHYTPTLLTTVGILGTFAGIISGLLGFDVENIDQSIGHLLAGLKTAFTTSLVGMLLSIAYKLLVSTGLVSPKADDVINEDEIGVAELYAVMQEQSEGIRNLQSVIGGDADTSLVGQIKLMRSDLNDQSKGIQKSLEAISDDMNSLNKVAVKQQESFAEFQEKLWIKMQDFADMLSKSATEQVINALKEVIADFNNNLTEQFGENFKQLNEAVLKLVEWQENYRIQLMEMGEQYQQGVSAITQTEASVANISEESKAIPVAMENLKDVLEVNQHQLDELHKHLEVFADVRDKAVEAVPEIRQQIDLTVDGIKHAADTMVGGMKEGSEQLQNAIITSTEGFVTNSSRVNDSLKGASEDVASNSEKTRQMFDDALSETNSILRNLVADLKDDGAKMNDSFREASQSLVVETEKARSTFEQGLETMRTQMTASLQQLADLQTQESQKVLTGMSQHADSALKDTSEAVQKQVKMLDDAMALEVNRVMTEMGRALATITQQFTTDYQKLVNEMQRVTRMQGVN